MKKQPTPPKKLKPETVREKLVIVETSIHYLSKAQSKNKDQIDVLIRKNASLSVEISKKTKYRSLLLKEMYTGMMFKELRNQTSSEEE